MANPLPRDIAPAFAQPVAPDHVRARLREILGLDVLPGAVDFAVEDTADEGDLTVTRVMYGNSLGEKLDAVIMAPVGTALPGIVCMHGTGGSIERVVGTELRLEGPGGQLLGWGRALARRGYATISISLKGSVVRRGTVAAFESEAKLLEAYGRPHMGIVAEEALLAARVLAAQPFVDGAKIGLTGMSLGGLASWYAMACDPWVAAAASICGGLGRLARVIHDGDVDRHSSLIYVPHLLRYFDHPEIVAHCIAPRPFMHVGPTGDVDMPRAGVDEMKAVVGEAYGAVGCAERFKVYQPPGNHVFAIEYYEWMVAWFEEFLQ